MKHAAQTNPAAALAAQAANADEFALARAGTAPLGIAIFASYLPPHVGGIDVVAASQADVLAGRGHKVTIITSACGAPAGVTRKRNQIIRRIPAWNIVEEKLGAAFPLFAPSLLWHGFRAVRNADVVHAHDAFYLSSLVAALWCRVLGKPLVLTQHVDAIPHPNRLLARAQKIAYATTGKFIFHSSKKIIFLNSRVEQFLRAAGVQAHKLSYLPNGVDTKRFTPVSDARKQALREQYGLPTDKLLALFSGRYIPRKGFATLVSVPQIDGLDIVFIGGDLPKEPGRSDHHFLPPVNHTAVHDIYSMCDIFILPSQGEGFPCSVQEAMSCGLPVITTDDPAYNVYDIDRERLALIRPTAEAIHEHLHRVHCDGKLRTIMGHYSRRYATSRFDWHANVSQLQDIYAECCA